MSEDGTKARGVIAVCIAILLMTALVGSFMLNPSERQQSNLNLIIGALIGALSTIVGFYFGSSSGAKQLVAGQQKILEAAVPGAAAAATLGGSAAGPSGKPEDPVSVTEVPTKVATLPPDPRFVAFRESALAINPAAAEDGIAAAWRELSPKLDIKLP